MPARPLALLARRLIIAPHRTHGWRLVVLAVLVALALVSPVELRWPDFGTYDWLAYWSFPRGLLLGRGYGDQAWLQAVQEAQGYNTPYFRELPYPVLRLWNPPPLTLLLVPLSALPFSEATMLWVGGSTLLYGHAALTLNRALRRPLPAMAVLALAFVCSPFLVAMGSGQVTTVLVACLIYAWQAQRRGTQLPPGC